MEKANQKTIYVAAALLDIIASSEFRHYFKLDGLATKMGAGANDFGSALELLKSTECLVFHDKPKNTVGITIKGIKVSKSEFGYLRHLESFESKKLIEEREREVDRKLQRRFWIVAVYALIISIIGLLFVILEYFNG